MDTQDTGINLLRTRAVLSHEELSLLDQLRKLSVVMVVVVFFLGVISVSAYVFFQSQWQSLEQERLDVFQKISASANKEILTQEVIDRFAKVSYVKDKQIAWDTVLNTVFRIAAPPDLVSLEVAEGGSLRMVVVTNSVSAFHDIVRRAVSEVGKGTIQNPYIQTVEVQSDGVLNATLLLSPVL